MNTVVIGAARSSTSSPAITFPATGAAVCVRQWTNSAEAAYAAAARRLRRAVSDRKEALMHRLEGLLLELLAAVVLIAIFMIVTDPAARND